MSGVEHPQGLPADERELAAPTPPGGFEYPHEQQGVAVPAPRPGEVQDERPPVEELPGRFDDPAAGWQQAARPAMRRGVHATTATELLLNIPSFLLSLLVVYLVAQLVAAISGATVLVYVIVAAWLGSGLLVVWRPVEDAVAVVVLRLRRPTPGEQQVLDAAWSAVSQSAGVDGDAYRLWVEESDEINAIAANGRTIAVTRWALRLPPRQLEAILAHELGHHLAGHTWIAFLGYWYSLPGRAAKAVVWFLLWLIVGVSFQFGWIGALLGVTFALAVLCVGAVAVLYFPPLLLVFALPFLLALVMRHGELHADRVAAQLGYGQPLLELLHQDLEEGYDVRRQAAGWRARALSSHPAVASRIRALELHLRQPGS